MTRSRERPGHMQGEAVETRRQHESRLWYSILWLPHLSTRQEVGGEVLEVHGRKDRPLPTTSRTLGRGWYADHLQEIQG